MSRLPRDQPLGNAARPCNVVVMATTRGERLRIAREKRFKSARAAGKALGIPVSTYGAHERAESPGGRDYGPNEARRYARHFGVTPEWLLIGRPNPIRSGLAKEPIDKFASRLRIVGYVGIGAQVHLYTVAPENLEE